MKDTQEKTILWQDPTLNRTLLAYRKAAKELTALMNGEVKDLGIAPSDAILKDLCSYKSTLAKQALTELYEGAISSLVAPLKKKALEDLPKVLNQVDVIAQKAAKDILKRDIEFNVPIDMSLLTWYGKGIHVDEQNITDAHTIYLDNEQKETAKKKAESIIAAVDDLNKYVQDASLGQLRGFGQENTFHGWPLLAFCADETLTIDFEAFKHL